MIQREETRRAVMGQPAMENPEVKAYIAGPRATPNPRYENRGEQLKCEYCKREGHTKEKYCHLHPELRPKGLRRGEDIWQGGKSEELRDSKRGTSRISCRTGRRPHQRRSHYLVGSDEVVFSTNGCDVISDPAKNLLYGCFFKSLQ
jgi:hypothetical protein